MPDRHVCSGVLSEAYSLGMRGARISLADNVREWAAARSHHAAPMHVLRDVELQARFLKEFELDAKGREQTVRKAVSVRSTSFEMFAAAETCTQVLGVCKALATELREAEDTPQLDAAEEALMLHSAQPHWAQQHLIDQVTSDLLGDNKGSNQGAEVIPHQGDEVIPHQG